MAGYWAVFEPAPEGGFVITFPDFDWGITQAENEPEGVTIAQDALLTMIQEQIRQAELLPAPARRARRQARWIELPALASAKLELYRAFQSSGMTKAELGRQLGMHKANVDRLFDLRHGSRLDQIEAGYRVLGKRLVVGVDEAA
ncbi:MAG: type II toxin-antitoxin system HicB family antitoxin [Acidobacteria bacterium]|nr:type II toxin-antitoxin system HicB family antitoxin [Acidobacteriota bacterium]